MKAGAVGRRPPEKKTQTRMFAFFFTYQPTATAMGCPSPFEPLKDGFATGATVGSVESKPLLFSYEWGKLAARGRDNICRLHVAAIVHWF